MENNNLLVLKNINKTFSLTKSSFLKKVKLRALNNINLTIRNGEVLGLVGESGCGKSTLGNIIAGIEQRDTGTISFNGLDISTPSLRKKHLNRNSIQMIFQDSQGSLNPKMKLKFLINEIMNRYKKELYPGTEKDKIISSTLSKVGLNIDLLNKYPSYLSGGEAQRFNIALAILLKPKLIVADEAVSSLDVSIQAQVLNLMNSLKDEFNLTYLFISHNLDVVKAMSDRMAVMYLGEIVEYGLSKEIYINPRHPYTKILISSIPSLLNERQNYLPIKGEVPDATNIPNGCPFHTRCPHVMDKCKIIVPPKYKFNEGYVRCHLYENKLEEEA